MKINDRKVDRIDREGIVEAIVRGDTVTVTSLPDHKDTAAEYRRKAYKQAVVRELSKRKKLPKGKILKTSLKGTTLTISFEADKKESARRKTIAKAWQ